MDDLTDGVAGNVVVGVVEDGTIGKRCLLVLFSMILFVSDPF